VPLIAAGIARGPACWSSSSLLAPLLRRSLTNGAERQGPRRAICGPVPRSFINFCCRSSTLTTEGRALAGCTPGAAPARKKSREVAYSRRGWSCSFDAKAVRQSPITVRLWADSVNPFRHQIYKSFVSVAVKPQTAKPPALHGGFAFSHTRRLRVLLRRASLGIRTGGQLSCRTLVLASLTARGRPRSDQESIQLRQHTFYG
jgi:hypothetical protein